jgi:hypothetical protein
MAAIRARKIFDTDWVGSRTCSKIKLRSAYVAALPSFRKAKLAKFVNLLAPVVRRAAKAISPRISTGPARSNIEFVPPDPLGHLRGYPVNF